MSKFATKMVAGLSAIYDRLGDLATYRDRNNQPSACSIIVQHELDEYGESVRVKADSVLIRVRCSEVDERPLRGETFTVTDSSTEYVVEQTLDSDEFEHRVIAK